MGDTFAEASKGKSPLEAMYWQLHVEMCHDSFCGWKWVKLDVDLIKTD
jgi:hypothetical protein